MEAESKRARKSDVLFTDEEAEFLTAHVIGRLATVSPKQQPHVVPVAYSFDGTSIYFSGYGLANSRKYRNILANDKVAFVVDDLASRDPWLPRGIEVEGRAESIAAEGKVAVKIEPAKKRSWGLGRD